MEPATLQEEPISHDTAEHLGTLLARLQKAVANLKKHEQNREKEAKIHAQHAEDLKQKVTKLLEETGTLKAERDQLRQQLKHVEGRNHNLQKHMDQVSTRLDAAINKIGELID